MFHWEPEGRDYCTMSMAIAPLSFSIEHLWIMIAPFWLSNEDMQGEFTGIFNVFLNCLKYPNKVSFYGQNKDWIELSWINSWMILRSQYYSSFPLNPDWPYCWWRFAEGFISAFRTNFPWLHHPLLGVQGLEGWIICPPCDNPSMGMGCGSILMSASDWSPHCVRANPYIDH